MTETWLNEYDREKNKEMRSVTHTFVHTPRKDTRGGRVGLVYFVRHVIKLKWIKLKNGRVLNICKLVVSLVAEKTVFIVLYRAPNLSARVFIDDFRKYLEMLDMVNANVFICGDFNIWMEDRENYTVKGFCEMMKSFNLVKKVEKITSVGGHIWSFVTQIII